MPDITKILVPTDGSTYALKAAGLAGEFARRFEASVRVIHVQDESVVVAAAWNAVSVSQDDTTTVREALEQRATDEEVADTLVALGDLPTAPEIAQRWGHPVEQICHDAETANVDLIVLGSHGKSALARAVLGSVCNGVVNAAPCAVTVVREPR
ncbi:MAG: universal stress protein [Pseudomonadota bacterium]